MAEEHAELEEQLMEVGNKLLNPPDSVQEILALLDEVGSCLSKVEQAPTESMLNALDSTLKAVVDERLIKHTDADVKVAVASCISEITRITAPEAPYSDDQMRDVFTLIVSSFGGLADNTSPSFSKRVMILETVAKVRSCVVMLDLECDAQIIEMFQLFLNSIRDHHQEIVFSSMETIMTLVLTESEEISLELLSPLLASLRKDNKGVLPPARKLGEKVLEKCATKVKPYLTQAIKSLGASIVDYIDVVASICSEVPETVGQNDGLATDENKVGAPSEEIPEAVKEIVVDASTEKPVEPANGVSQEQEDKSVDSNSSKKHGDEDGAEQPKDDDTPMKTELHNLDVAALDTESNQELTTKKNGDKVPDSKERTELTGSSDVDTDKGGEHLPDVKTDVADLSVSVDNDPAAESAPAAEKKKEADECSLPKDTEMESETIISPSLSKTNPEETLFKKGGGSKKNESSTKDSAPSSDDIPKKASEENSFSEDKPPKRHGKKETGPMIDEDKIASHKDMLKKERDTSSKVEEEQIKTPAKEVELGSVNGDQPSSKQVENKKHGSRGKAVSGSDGVKSSTKDSSKKKLSSSKTLLKSMKDVQPAKEILKATLKRKHTPDSSKGYGQEVVGEKIKVWWPIDREFYAGKIESFDPEKGRHTVVYDDGDVEVLNLKRERFEFIESEAETDEEDAPVPDDSDLDAASDTPLKKVKMNYDQSKKQVKSDATPKRSVGVSSAKSNSAKRKSGQKVKESRKAYEKLLDGTKTGETMEDDEVSSKSKDHQPKSGSKSAIGSKGSGKLKSDVKLVNGGRKADSSKDRAEEDKGESENSTESATGERTPKLLMEMVDVDERPKLLMEMVDVTKPPPKLLKATSSSRVRRSGSKSNKKRRRA